MNDTTNTSGMNHAATPPATPPALPTIGQQLAAKLGELQAAQAVRPSEALAGLASDVSAYLTKHAGLVAERDELVLKAGAGAPAAVARRVAIRDELRTLTDEMEEQIVDVSAYLKAHAADVTESQRAELEAHAATARDAAASIAAAVELDKALAAVIPAAQKFVAVNEERWQHAAHVLAARHADDPMKCMDAQLVNAPRCLGIHGGTIATFGRFVQQLVDILGRNHRVEGALRERDLAYRSGVESFEYHALHDAAQIAKDFASAFPEPPLRIDAVTNHDYAVGGGMASYSTANGPTIDDSGKHAAQRWADQQSKLAPAQLVDRRPVHSEADE